MYIHMTDTNAHNKGLANKLAETMDREHPADQLFCNSHAAIFVLVVSFKWTENKIKQESFIR